MFKQVKSALFWYYLFKFRRRVILIILLLVIALFANAIYGDVVEYLKLKDKLAFLEIALISKWLIIIFNIVFSTYLLLLLNTYILYFPTLSNFQPHSAFLFLSENI